MTRAHGRDVLARAPRGLARTFTLREAADLLLSLPGDAQPEGDNAGERLRGLVKALAGARSARTAGDGTDDDVLDPIDRPVEVHEEAGELIAAALLPILRRIADLVAAGPMGPVGRAMITESSGPGGSSASPAA